MEKQLTAVEWFTQELDKRHCVILNYPEYQKLFEQAKAMFEEQIIKARQDGHESTYNTCESGCMGREILEGSNEQYYNETFKSE